MSADLESRIEAAWEDRANVTPQSTEVREAVEAGLALLDSGEGRVASWRLTQETVQRLGLVPDDSEGLIDHIRAIDSVIVAVFFEELSDGKIRVSSRSKSEAVDVGKVCGHFGGGGHTLAAGARMAGTITEVETKFLKQVYHALEGNH